MTRRSFLGNAVGLVPKENPKKRKAHAEKNHYTPRVFEFEASPSVDQPNEVPR
jgi:hypothetical protein